MSKLTLTELMATNPDGALEKIAAEYQVSLLTVIQALPHCRLLAGQHFDQVCQAVEQWGNVTILVNTPDIIFEFYGNLPSGKHGHGYYNLQGKQGFSGHISAQRCQHIAFIERKFMGVDTASILFLNDAGQAMFKIFVGRDEQRNLQAEQLSAFRQLSQIK
ncbi:heme utilization protein HuvX [Orbus hercynius]|uniref:Heme utilization protein HuvX n=1 Tax=Orbus hercynius TaxID=593135 RepID=A0A495RJM3_9GAMM|nr:heme utilization cystosolic carrier protein HutX [Orbus hercynius]RKS87742.1 heme utilization protein HuvX [Orbus hercynius]